MKNKKSLGNLIGSLVVFAVLGLFFLQVRQRDAGYEQFNEMMSGFDMSEAPAEGAGKLAVYLQEERVYTSRYVPEELLAEAQEEVAVVILVHEVEAERFGERYPSLEVSYLDLASQEILGETLIYGHEERTTKGARYKTGPDEGEVAAWIRQKHQYFLENPRVSLDSDKAVTAIMAALDIYAQPAPGADKFIAYRMDTEQYTANYIPEEYLAMTPEEVAVVLFLQPGKVYNVQWYDLSQQKVLSLGKFDSAMDLGTKEYVIRNQELEDWIKTTLAVNKMAAGD